MPGKYFEELEVGMKFKHALGRTVTEMDNVLFSALTMNTQPLHVDEDSPRRRSLASDWSMAYTHSDLSSA